MLADGGLLGWRRSPALAAFTVDRRETAFLFSVEQPRSPVWHKADVIIALTDVRFPGKANISFKVLECRVFGGPRPTADSVREY
jgi:hypothetical protein